ncbi:MAG: hypothetical protein IPP68_08010 [Elusimicrobia bacterium]|nr:hypothetical protein [Elusimicrobiota bacterium]
MNSDRTRRAQRKSQRGFILPLVILILALLAIFLPSLIQMSKDDSRWSTRKLHIDEIVTIAESGLDRGSWTLGDSESNWQNAKTGVPIPEFNYDRVWTDLDPAYQYKIKFSSGPGPEEVTVRCKVRSVRNAQTVRTLMAVYTRNFVEALVMKNDLNPASDVYPRVHWGPIKSYAGLGLAPAFLTADVPHFPRKYARNGVFARDTTRDEHNSDGQEYWAFDKNIGDPPAIDYPYYRSKAAASSLPRWTAGLGTLVLRDGATAAVSNGGAATGLFLCADNWDGSNRGVRFRTDVGQNYVFSNSTSVFFIENSTNANCGAVIEGKVLLDLEAFIVAGPSNDLWMHPHWASYNATIPVNADMEYRQTDASTTWTTSGMGAVWASGRYPYLLPDKVGFHGFLHVQDGLCTIEDNNDDVRLVGVVYVKTLKTDFDPPGQGLDIYFDEAVASRMKVIYTPVRRRYYNEDKSDMVWP